MGRRREWATLPDKERAGRFGMRPSTKKIAGIMTQTAKGLPETVGEGEDQQPLWHGNCSRLSDT